jgi:hypothetical protein
MSSDVLDYPDALAELSEEAIFEALVRRKLNISAAARDLGVPSGPLRAMVIADPRYGKAAAEFLEHRQDMADSVIYDALIGDDPRSRLAAAFFTTRFGAVAAARGWITARAPEADVTTAAPRVINIRWANSDGSIAPPPPTEQVMRDGKLIEMRVYGTGDDHHVESDPPEPEMNLTQLAKNAISHSRGAVNGQQVDGDINELEDVNIAAVDNASVNEPLVDAMVEHELGADDPDEQLKPLIGVNRDKVIAMLRKRPRERDRILATVAKNGFRTDWL